MDPHAMEGDVHLPEDETKCKLTAQVHTNVHLSGRISEYGMICIDIYDIYTFIDTYIDTYRYINI